MEKESWTPEKLLGSSGMFWSSCALHAAVDLDIFTFMDGRGSVDCKVLGRACKSRARSLDMLLTAMAAMELLHKRGDSYCLTDFSKKYLSKKSEDYLGYIIMHHKNLVPAWSKLSRSVKSGKPFRKILTSKVQRDSDCESFLMGMFNVATRQAPTVVREIDLSGRRRFLDLGGGPGTYAIFFCRQYPDLSATIFDFPDSRPFAEKIVADFDLAERIEFRTGDCTKDVLPGGHDVIWISQLLHAFSDETSFAVLQKSAAALEPGGLLLIQEFFMNNERSGPAHPALFGLNMLVNTEAGKVYTPAEIMAMLDKIGLKDIKLVNLPLKNGCAVVSAVKE